MRSLSKGILARGRMELRKCLKGGKLTYKQAILAKCYDCMGYYIDGKTSCEIPECPLYPVMPYKKTSKALETSKNGVAVIEDRR